MDNNFGAQDIITGRGLGIGGFGYGYGIGHGTFAGPGANAVRLNRNEDIVRDQNNCTREVIGIGQEAQREAFTSAERARADAVTRGELAFGFRDISDKMGTANIASAITEGNNRVEFADRLAAMRAESAACCCETQKLIIEENSKTREKMDQNLIAQLNRELVDSKNVNSDNRVIRANDAAIAAQTSILLAHLGNNGGHHRP